MHSILLAQESKVGQVLLAEGGEHCLLQNLILADYCRGQLLVIAHEHHFLNSLAQETVSVSPSCLRGFIQNPDIRLELLELAQFTMQLGGGNASRDHDIGLLECLGHCLVVD